MNLKKIISLVLLIAIVIGLVAVTVMHTSNKKTNAGDKMDVVVTSFAAYDFVRQIAGDKVNIEYILGPGVDAHSYDPSAQDLISIQKADVFIYIGGNMEKWTDKVLGSLDTSETKTLSLLDIVDMMEEVEIDGAEKHHHKHEEEEHEGEHHDGEVEFDEHVWTSPRNSIIMVQNLANILSEEDKENEKTYQENAKKYISEIEEVQAKIQNIIDNRKRDRLVFGDKMPMQYFLHEFGITASAAFQGCSTETEPSTATIAYLINKIREENIPVVLYIELNNGKVANTIAEETDVVAMQIQSLHNVSKSDFENGETYVTLMNKNLDVLKKALY